MLALESPSAIWSKHCLKCLTTLPRNISRGKQRCKQTHSLTLPFTCTTLNALLCFPLTHTVWGPVPSSCSLNSAPSSTCSAYLPPACLTSLWLPLTPSRHTHTASSFSLSLTLISQGSTLVLLLFLLTDYFASGLTLSSAQLLHLFLGFISFLSFPFSTSQLGNTAFLVFFEVASVTNMFLLHKRGSNPAPDREARPGITTLLKLKGLSAP